MRTSPSWKSFSFVLAPRNACMTMFASSFSAMAWRASCICRDISLTDVDVEWRTVSGRARASRRAPVVARGRRDAVTPLGGRSALTTPTQATASAETIFILDRCGSTDWRGEQCADREDDAAKR